MIREEWLKIVENYPEAPGVYMMKGKGGEILYIGKAKNLKSRLKQYFQKRGDERYFVRKLPVLLKDIEIILTEDEGQAILLEAEMIRRHKPRFNVLLKDRDRKNFLFISTEEEFPRLELFRGYIPKKRGKGIIFGPYLSMKALREVLELLDKNFLLRSCDDKSFYNRSRPCLEYQIGRCLGPCAIKISKERYWEEVESVKLFLEGKKGELLERLEKKMWKLSEEQKYEEAARYRDIIFHLLKIIEEDKVWNLGKNADIDAIAAVRKGDFTAFQLLSIKGGILADGAVFIFEDLEFDLEEGLASFVGNYYLSRIEQIPDEIWLNKKIEEKNSLEKILREKSGKKVRIKDNFRRKKEAKIVELAEKNAFEKIAEKVIIHENNYKILTELKEFLELKRIPKRIECVDNSHLGGKGSVSAISVFIGGKPSKREYRRYDLTHIEGGDDFELMREVLKRRFREERRNILPDLLVIDGGKGQLNAAVKVLQEYNLFGIFDVIAIAKDKEDRGVGERVFFPYEREGIKIDKLRPEQLLLLKIRDEAHRTAVNYQRKIREKKLFK